MDGQVKRHALAIGYVMHMFPCISESFILDQIVGMVEAGEKVRIFAATGPGDEPIDPRVGQWNLLRLTHYLPKTGGNHRRLFWQAGLALLADPRALRWSQRPGRPKGFLPAARALAQIHRFTWPRPGRWDIVHYQFGCIGRDYILPGTFRGARRVVSFRGHDYSTLPNLHGRGMYTELFRDVDAVMVVCDYGAKRLLELGCPPEKLIVHYSGTDVAQFDYRARVPDPSGEIRLLSVARLEETKGLEYALQAVAAVAGRTSAKVRYGIIGDGSLRPQLEELARSLHISERVEFYGAQALPFVKEMMHRAHIFILPSVTAKDGGQEGVPGSIREAMATGMPVISTFHAGIPELVENERSGYLVKERDSAAIAESLLRLIERPEEWQIMGRCGRDRVESRFDIRQLNRRLNNFYRFLVGGGVPARFGEGETASESTVA